MAEEAKAIKFGASSTENDQVAVGSESGRESTDRMGWPFEGWPLHQTDLSECVRESIEGNRCTVVIFTWRFVLFGATPWLTIGRFESPAVEAIYRDDRDQKS